MLVLPHARTNVALPLAGVGTLATITASANGTALSKSTSLDASGIRIWTQGGSVTFYIGPAGSSPAAALSPTLTLAAADGPYFDIPLGEGLDVFFTAVTGNPVAQRM